MNCPYCNNIMEPGYIKTHQASQWTPAEGSNPLSRWFNGVRLIGFSHIPAQEFPPNTAPIAEKSL